MWRNAVPVTPTRTVDPTAVPLPTHDSTLLTPPDAAEAAFLMRGFVSASSGPAG